MRAVTNFRQWRKAAVHAQQHLVVDKHELEWSRLAADKQIHRTLSVGRDRPTDVRVMMAMEFRSTAPLMSVLRQWNCGQLITSVLRIRHFPDIGFEHERYFLVVAPLAAPRTISAICRPT